MQSSLKVCDVWFVCVCARVRADVCLVLSQASYDTILVAAALLDEVRKVGFSMPSYVDVDGFRTRYGKPIGTMSGEEYIWRLAQVCARWGGGVSGAKEKGKEEDEEEEELH